MMEDISISSVAAAVTLVVGNVVGLKWVRSDLEKNRVKIDDLSTKLDKTMTKAEISEMVKQCVDPIKSTLADSKTSMDNLNANVLNMTVAVARMDERMKTFRHDEQ